MGALLLGVALATTDAAAQYVSVTGGAISCDPPNGYKLEFMGDLSSVWWYDVVACYAPVYGPFSPPTKYVQEYPDYADGDETVNVPRYGTDWSVTPENTSAQLQGCYVWFEYGDWVWVDWPEPQTDRWMWNTYGALCDWYWIPCYGGSCFAAGTPLLTPEGSKPIEQFKTGDWILSTQQDDPQAPAVARRVKEVIPSRGKLLNIKVSGQTIQATREHPFYVHGKGWTPAASLRAGDSLRGHGDHSAAVESIVEGAESPVYNVSVEEDGTYFVGRPDWGFSAWVYGACDKPETPLQPIALSQPAGSQLRNWQTFLEQTALGNTERGRPGIDLRRLFGQGIAANEVLPASAANKPQRHRWTGSPLSTGKASGTRGTYRAPLLNSPGND